MNEPGKQQKSYRGLLWSVGLLALAMSIISVSLVHQYGTTRPTLRDDSQGRTHATKIHDRTVYLTQGELAAAFLTHAAAILSMATFVGILMKSRFSKTSGTKADATNLSL
jgi:hypothetical protein